MPALRQGSRKLLLSTLFSLLLQHLAIAASNIVPADHATIQAATDSSASEDMVLVSGVRARPESSVYLEADRLFTSNNHRRDLSILVTATMNVDCGPWEIALRHGLNNDGEGI